ncbi:MAG: hypothetical protein R3C05_20600 [Pirellulaceae bacterium]
MDRETVLSELRTGPIRIVMNDGTSHDVDSSEMALVDDIAARVMFRDDKGKYRTKVLALVCMVSIEQQERAS